MNLQKLGKLTICAIIFEIIFYTFVIVAFAVDMEAIKIIESGGNPHAYNKSSGATGLYQVTPICLADFNKFSKRDIIYTGKIPYYRIEDMYDPLKNKDVAFWYLVMRIPQLLKSFGHEDTLENRLISYNCGISCVGKKLPRETINYINKYKEATRGKEK